MAAPRVPRKDTIALAISALAAAVAGACAFSRAPEPGAGAVANRDAALVAPAGGDAVRVLDSR